MPQKLHREPTHTIRNDGAAKEEFPRIVLVELRGYCLNTQLHCLKNLHSHRKYMEVEVKFMDHFMCVKCEPDKIPLFLFRHRDPVVSHGNYTFINCVAKHSTSSPPIIFVL